MNGGIAGLPQAFKKGSFSFFGFAGVAAINQGAPVFDFGVDFAFSPTDQAKTVAIPNNSGNISQTYNVGPFIADNSIAYGSRFIIIQPGLYYFGYQLGAASGPGSQEIAIVRYPPGGYQSAATGSISITGTVLAYGYSGALTNNNAVASVMVWLCAGDIVGGSLSAAAASGVSSLSCAFVAPDLSGA